MADVVLNSLGIQTWQNSFASVGLNGGWVTFGGLTGADVKLNIQSLYSKQVRLIGSTGGTRKEITELIDMSKELKTRVWLMKLKKPYRHYLIRKEMEEFF